MLIGSKRVIGTIRAQHLSPLDDLTKVKTLHKGELTRYMSYVHRCWHTCGLSLKTCPGASQATYASRSQTGQSVSMLGHCTLQCKTSRVGE